MAQEIQYENVTNASVQRVRGSDGRFNVSSRQDSRMYYVSRDNGQAYVLSIEDLDAEAGDIVLYLRNDSTAKKLFVDDIHINTENAAKFRISIGDAVTPTGTPVTPVNLNRASVNAAAVTGLGNGAVGGVAESVYFGTVRIGAGGFEEYDPKDALILGQNQNIIIEYDAGTTGEVEIEIFFFLE